MAEDIAVIGFEVEKAGLVEGVQHMKKLKESGDQVGETAKKSGGLIDRSFRSAAGGIGEAHKEGRGLVTGLGLMKTAIAALGVGLVAREALQFSNALAEVSTLVDTTSFDMEQLKDDAVALAEAYGANPTQTVKAYYQAISAGAETAAEATEMVTAANKLAVGGVTDVETAIDGLTTIMNAYGDKVGSVEEVSDDMFAAMKAGKTTIGELSSSIGNVAPLAEAAGVSFEEVLSATAALTKGGIDTSVAMNGIRAAMAAIVGPTEQSKKLAEELGLEFNATALESKGLAKFMEEVQEATGGSTEQMKILFGGIEALTPMLALTGKASKDFADNLEYMKDNTGDAQEAFDKMAASPGFQIDRILNILAANFQSMGESMLNFAVPALTAIADGLVWGFDALEKFGSVVGPLIPDLSQFGDTLVVAAGAAGGITLLAAALKGLGIAAGLLSSPLVIAGALAAVVYEIYQNWDGIAAYFTDLWGKVGQAFTTFESAVVDWMQGFVISGMNMGRDFIKNMIDGITNTATNIFNKVKETGGWFVDGMIEGIQGGIGALTGAAEDMANAGVQAVDTTIQSRSPSRVMMLRGEYFAQGFAVGITSGSEQVVSAAEEMSKKATKVYDQIIADLDRERIGLEFGEDALRSYDLMKKKLNKTQIESIQMYRQENAALENYNQQVAANQRSYEQLNEDLQVHGVFMREGKVAAEAMRLELGGMSKAQAEYTAVTRDNMATMQDFKQALVDSIANADGIKDAFSNLGKWMKNWLQEQAAHFAANKITVALEGGGLEGFLPTDASSIASKAGYVGFMYNLGYSLGSAIFGGAKKATAQGYELGVEGGTYIGDGFTSYMKKRSWFGGTNRWTELEELDATVVAALNKFFSDLDTTISDQFGALGVSAADSILDDLNIAKQRIESEAEFDAWLERVTIEAYKVAFDQMEPELQAAVTNGLDPLIASADEWALRMQEVATTANVLMPQFENAGLIYSGTVNEMILQSQLLVDALGGTDRALELLNLVVAQTGGNMVALSGQIATYEHQIHQMQSTMGLAEGQATSLGQSIGILATSTATGVTGIEQMDVASAAFANGLGEYVLGVHEATGAVIIDLAALEADMQSLDLNIPEQAALYEKMLELKEAVTGVGQGVGLTSDEILEMYYALGPLNEENAEYAAQLLELYGITVAHEQALEAQAKALQQVDDWTLAFGVHLDTTTAKGKEAALALIDLAGGVDQFVAMQENAFNKLLTTQQQTDIQMAQSVTQLQAWNDSLGLTGEAAIDTADEFWEYIRSLDLTTEAGRAAYHEAMQMVDALYFLQEAGMSLEEGLASLPPEMRDMYLKMLGYTTDGMGNIVSEFEAAIQKLSDTVREGVVDLNNSETTIGSALGAMGDGVLGMGDDLNDSVDNVEEANERAIESFMGMSEGAVTAAGEVETATIRISAAFNELVQVVNQGSEDIYASSQTTKGGFGDMATSANDSTIDMVDSFRQMSQEAAQTSNDLAGSSAANQSSFNNLISMMNSAAGQIQGSTGNMGGSFNSLVGTINSGAGSVRSATSSAGGALNSFSGAMRNVASAARSAASIAQGAASSARNFASQAQFINSNYHGIDYVPHNNYLTYLHEGERVETKAERNSRNTSESQLIEEVKALRREIAENNRVMEFNTNRIMNNTGANVAETREVTNTVRRELRREA